MGNFSVVASNFGDKLIQQISDMPDQNMSLVKFGQAATSTALTVIDPDDSAGDTMIEKVVYPYHILYTYVKVFDQLLP